MQDRWAEHWAAAVCLVLVVLAGERWVLEAPRSSPTCNATVILVVGSEPPHWVCPAALQAHWPSSCGEAPRVEAGHRLEVTEACTVRAALLSGAVRLGAGLRLDVNSASWTDLQAIPGIGPSLATRVVAGRPYATVAALERVRGIGPRTRARLIRWLRAQPSPSPPRPGASAPQTP